MNKASRIYVAGHNGLVGRALVRRLEKQGYENLILAPRSELDLTNQQDVYGFFAAEQPDVVFLAAAKVGGIKANSTSPADFVRDNLQIQTNIIDAAHKNGASKLVFLGSSCIYPKLADQPISEKALLTGLLEPTNQPYAIAKIAGIEMCQAYRRQYDFDAISLMPTNLYGPYDNFDLESSHVLAALIRKFFEAVEGDKESVEIWGTGSPRREFLHVDDLAAACEFLAINYSSPEPINIGVGEDISIKDLATCIGRIAGFQGSLSFDHSKPDGTPRKLLDVTKLSDLGWSASISLSKGIESTYAWYKAHRVG